jgi:hypothetical protein
MIRFWQRLFSIDCFITVPRSTSKGRATGSRKSAKQACSGLLQRGMRNTPNPKISQSETGNQGTFYSGKKGTFYSGIDSPNANGGFSMKKMEERPNKPL